MELTRGIADFIHKTGYANFSPKEVQAAKDLILDAVGGMIGGARERVTAITIEYARETGGKAECGILGGGLQTSLLNAALANGTSCHSQELEAIGLYTGSNPMTNIPVALSVAEKFHLSGKAVIEGTVIGLEVQTKLGMSGPGSFDRGFSSIPLYGSMGAAASAGKMMQLSREQLQNAFGIAIAQSSGQQRQQGSMTHLLESGIACRNGVTAAMLAKGGMTADPSLIEGERGFYDLFCSGGRGYKEEGVLPSLGNPFCVSGVFVKKYGCCFFNHRAMDALVQLLEEHKPHPEDIKSVEAEVPPFVANMLRFPSPQNGEDAKFSLHQALGAILLDGKVDLPYVRPFNDAGTMDPKYQAARKKVKVIERKDWAGGRSAPWSTPVTIYLKDGRKFTKSVNADDLKGGAKNPLSRDELMSRFRAMTEGFLSSSSVTRSLDLLSNLENQDSISELMRLVTFGR
jgi:2-methylcitrate dehydratase PrpD